MTVDQRALLADLQKQVRLLEDDVRDRAAAVPEVAERLQAEHAEARRVGRTAASYGEWRDALVVQAAVGWVLGTVFVRFCEDNHLIADAWLSGPGDRLREAGERQTQFLVDQPRLNDRDWLVASFDHLAGLPAVAALFNRGHNPLYRLEISADGAEALVAFWRRRDDQGALLHDFTDAELSTRFLGDLYQDLSEAARKAFALLQTPEFVEELILDLTLDPAIDTFGLEDLKLIDPTCGSGHFLLGAFDRLLDAWTRQSPGMAVRERVQKALGSIHGVDINPFATAIARFRLTVAALKAEGLTRLQNAPGYAFHLGTGDSLLYGKDQGELFDSGLAHHQYAAEDLDDHPGILKRGRYHVVVGNPPYITVKDKALNEAYRQGYETCSGKYALSVPFAELFFRLAVSDGDRPGYVGQITSNSFMKREFGKKLIENFLPSQDLTHVIDTSGAYIPGHGTPTVILVGRRRIPRTTSLRAVLGIRGEPSAPKDPPSGRVWRSIVEHLQEPGFENEFVSVVDAPRAGYGHYPWSLSGGGAGDLFEMIDGAASSRLGQQTTNGIGPQTFTGDDEVFTAERPRAAWNWSHAQWRPYTTGNHVRDWAAAADVSLWPYDEAGNGLADIQSTAAVWPFRTGLRRGLVFGQTREERGFLWSEYAWVVRERIRAPRLISFAAVATHAHFVFVREQRVLNRHAPAFTLGGDATEDDHLALLGVLNSSTACFWLKQVSHNKGSTVDQRGARQATVDWENFYEFTGTKLQEFPLPSVLSPDRARRIEQMLERAQLSAPDRLREGNSFGREQFEEGRATYSSRRGYAIAEQEELDWEIYRAYGLVDEQLFLEPGSVPSVALGERAFEIVLARKAARGEADSIWFERHRSTPVTEIPAHWPDDYRALVERRIDLIESHPFLKLLERPDCKRRWADDPWEAKCERALRGWMLDRLGAKDLWHDGAGRPTTQSVAQLAGRLASDPDFLSVLELWAGGSISDVAKEIGRLVADEHVPFLAAYRYKPDGLRKRDEWERTWDLQRREDDGEDVGDIPVPAKYKPTEFAKPSYWKHRGKLDVPKERFISYPGAERGADATLVLGWAGWDHAEQAMALATMVVNRQAQDAWEAERLTPLLAGVAELEPWVKQWHAETDPRMGMSPAQAVTATLEQQLARLHLSRADLAAWQPPATTRGRPRTPKA